MALDIKEAEQQIRSLIWSGFYTPDDVFEIISEDLNDPYALSADDRTWIEETTERLAEQKTAEEANWPETTDWERLDEAFDRLDDAGILALHNSGTSQSDGIDDANDIARQMAGEGFSFRGWTFYHEQDLQRALSENILMLSFGSLNETEADPLTIAGEVVSVLKSAGFEVQWSGTPEDRISLQGFKWQKRGLGDVEDGDDEDSAVS